MQAQIKTWLEDFWDLIDISELLGRTAKVLQGMQNDFTFNVISIMASVVMSVFFFILALKFDYESTWNALSITREFIQEGTLIPETITGFSLPSFILLLVTLAPTAIELFGAAFARAQIRVVQLAVIALSIFDAVTDVPTVTVFLMKHAVYFDMLGWAISTLAYFIAFILWLFFATFGFELLLCMSVYITIFFGIRLFKGGGGTSNGFQQKQR
jgi:hypothetical protein